MFWYRSLKFFEKFDNFFKNGVNSNGTKYSLHFFFKKKILSDIFPLLTNSTSQRNAATGPAMFLESSKVRGFLYSWR